jgi:hypothetical protein
VSGTIIGMTTSTWTALEAEQAFSRAARSRRRAAMVRRLFRRCSCCGRLNVICDLSSGGPGGTREIPLGAIEGTVEPNRAVWFDADFRPAPATRARWQRVWMAMHRGVPLPPIRVVAVGEERYAVRDGHHRVSVAKALGVDTISAYVG